MNLFYLKEKNTNLRLPAILTEDKIFTYTDFFSDVSRYSDYLQSIGVRENFHCSILSDNSVDFIFLLFAIWNTGAVAIPLNINLLDKEVEQQIIQSESKFLFVSEKLKNRLPELNSKVKRIIFPLKKNYALVSHKPVEKINLQKIALIIYTSGTSGNPKGVMHSFSNLIESALSADHILKQVSEDRWLASLPFYHIGGLSILIRAFLYNASVIVPHSLKFENLITSIKKQKPTLASLVSTILKRFVERNFQPDVALRQILLGGGPTDNNLIIKAIELGWNIIKVYGSSETASMVTAFKVNEAADKIESSGIPLPGNRIIITDENRNPLPVNTKGEIAISGKSIMNGYWRNNIETKSNLINGFYFTGDFGYQDQDGYLFIDSRRTDIIISGGENINTLEVEEILLSYDGINEVCVFSLPDKEWGQIAVAAVVADKNNSEEEIRNFCKKNLASYKVPKKIFFTDTLPKTALGKVIKEEVRKRFQPKQNLL